MAFATLAANLRLNIADFSSALSKASQQMTQFTNRLNRDYGKVNDALKSHNLGLKDTARIVQGIIVAQGFYRVTNAIQGATSALWEFNKELDYAQVTYSALFGDASLANDFMSVLQEHAIETIFNYQDLAGISKKLLAYGIDYKNLMFIMEGLTNLGTMSGDPAALDRIALALGQIYTKGKLSAEEMRQLANAYVPITEIIQEKFNLSEDDLGRVGDLNLPAEEVINAIVDYANENFGAVGDAAMLTITGLESKIVDTLKTVGSQMLAPLTAAYKSFLVYISRGLENIRSAYAEGGIGGVFEYLVPDEGTQKTIRIFLANLKNLFMSVMSLGKAAGAVFGNFVQVFVAVFNAVAPAITSATNALAILINAMASTSGGAAILRVALVAAAGAFVLMRVQAMGALVVTVVTKAVNALSKALVVLASVISKHPILSLLAMLGIALVGISVSSNNANSALSGFFDTLAGANGNSSNDMLQKTEEEIKNANDALGQFNNRLEEGKDNAGDLEDSIGGVGDAAKKTNSLLSFDEVFKLNDPSKAASGGTGVDSSVLDDIEGIIGGLGALGDALIPEIPDFSEYFDGFNNNLLGGLSEDLKNKISAGGWGALIGGILGALIGAAFGNPLLGAKIGMAAGALVGVIFQEIEYAISNTAIGALSGIGAAISKAFGGSLFSVIKEAFTKPGSLSGLFKNIASIFTGTGLKSLLKGGIIGAAVGLFVDGIAHLLWSTLEEKWDGTSAESAKVGQTIGSVIGAIFGGLLGGPAGAIIGSSIGTFVGGFVGLFWEQVEDFFRDPKINLATIILGSIGPGWGIVGGSIFDHFFGDWSISLSELSDKISGWFADREAEVQTWLSDTGISQWWIDIKQGFSDWAEDTGSRLSTWWSDTTLGFSDWAEDTGSRLSTWWSDTNLGFSDWWKDTKQGFSDWWDSTAATFSDWDSITGDTLGDWITETTKGFATWVEDTGTDLSNWWSDTTAGFNDWVEDTDSRLSTWWSDTTAGFVKWCLDVENAISDWSTNTKQSISDWWTDTEKSLSDWWASTKQGFTDWASNTVTDISNWAEDTSEDINQWSTDVGTIVGGFCIATYKAIEDWVVDTKEEFDYWAGEIDERVSKVFTDAIEDVGAYLIDLYKDISGWFARTTTNVETLWSEMFNPDNWKTGWENVVDWFLELLGGILGWFGRTESNIAGWWEGLFDPDNWSSGWSNVKSWFSDLFSDISDWFSDLATRVSDWWDDLWDGKSVSVTGDYGGGGGSFSLAGHASGGVFNREHLARFAEGNKAEAIIPLENNRAMQPFVDAVSSGLLSTLAPIIASNSGSSAGLQPLYVGTLVADDRGLKELYKRFEVIQVQENARRGTIREVF